MTSIGEPGDIWGELDCFVHYYECGSLADGTAMICSTLACVLVESIYKKRQDDVQAPAVGHAIPAHADKGTPAGYLIPVRSLIDVLEELGATVTFDPEKSYEAARRHQVS